MIKLGAKKNAPELLLGLGLVTGTACVVASSKATVKAVDKNVIFKNEINNTASQLETGMINEEDAKILIRKTYIKYGLDLAKTYAIPVGLYAATVGSVFASYKIQKNRNIALSTALTAVTTAYTTLLAKLKNGAENGLTAQEVMDGYQVVDQVNEETGEVEKVKVKGEAISNLYEYRFDKMAAGWENSRSQNRCTLRSEENWANDMLNLQGHLFLNDVLGRLGLPKSKMGQIVGWKLNNGGDDYVSFNMIDLEEVDDERWCPNTYILNFNVDGDILNTYKDEDAMM